MTNINAPCIVCGFVGDADETDLGWVCSEKLSCFDRLKSNPPQLRSRLKDLREPPPQREGEEKRSAATQFPYTTDTSRLEKSQTGFRFCRVCDSVQPAAGHECGSEVPLNWWVFQERAEHAESLLCAIVFDHVVMMQGHHRPGMANCYFDCSLCEAAR